MNESETTSLSPKRRQSRTPATSKNHSNSEEDFQAALNKQKKKVVKEANILKKMMEMDEGRKAKRQERKAKLNDKVRKALENI